MTKLRCPASEHGVILQAYEEAGGFDAVNVLLPTRKPGWLRASTDPDLTERHKAMLTYSEARTLSMSGVTALVHDLARLAGMYAQPLPADTSPDLLGLLSNASRLMKEGGEAVHMIIEAHADGIITQAEAIDLKRELLEVNAVVLRLLMEIDKVKGA